MLQHAYAQSAGRQSSAYLEKSVWNLEMRQINKFIRPSSDHSFVADYPEVASPYPQDPGFDQCINGKGSALVDIVHQKFQMPGLLLLALHSSASWDHQQWKQGKSHSDWELHVPSPPLLSGFPIIAELNFWSKSLRKFLDTERNQVKLMLAGLRLKDVEPSRVT